MDQYISVDKAAKQIDVSKKTIYRMVKSNHISYIRLENGTIRINKNFISKLEGNH